MTDENPSDQPAAPSGERRVIKRYTNRKLYDTKDSRYVTLLQIAEMVRANEDVQIIDNTTKEDKTDVTLALIISEELKTRPHAISLTVLRALIRNRGERILTQLRDSPIGVIIPKDGEELPPNLTDEENDSVSPQEAHQKGLRATLEQWQHQIDDRIRAVLPTFATIRELQAQVERLGERLDAIESRLPGPSGEPASEAEKPPSGE